jgi:hypothetical protein
MGFYEDFRPLINNIAEKNLEVLPDFTLRTWVRNALSNHIRKLKKQQERKKPICLNVDHLDDFPF